VSVAQVLGATLTEFRCMLSAMGFPFHSFLGGDSEAADVSHFDLFTGLEIGGQVWNCNRGRSRSRAYPSCSASLRFGACLMFRPCLRFGFGFALGFHGWVARTVGLANDRQCLTLTMGIK
jgi:hypothetical protein